MDTGRDNAKATHMHRTTQTRMARPPPTPAKPNPWATTDRQPQTPAHNHGDQRRTDHIETDRRRSLTQGTELTKVAELTVAETLHPLPLLLCVSVEAEVTDEVDGGGQSGSAGGGGGGSGCASFVDSYRRHWRQHRPIDTTVGALVSDVACVVVGSSDSGGGGGDCGGSVDSCRRRQCRQLSTASVSDRSALPSVLQSWMSHVL